MHTQYAWGVWKKPPGKGGKKPSVGDYPPDGGAM